MQNDKINVPVPVIVPKNLMDVGTRFQHLTDLLEHWYDGTEAVKNSYARFPNPEDKLRLARLEAAVKMINIYLDGMSGRDTKQFGLASVVNNGLPKVPKWVEPEAEATA